MNKFKEILSSCFSYIVVGTIIIIGCIGIMFIAPLFAYMWYKNDETKQ